MVSFSLFDDAVFSFMPLVCLVRENFIQSVCQTVVMWYSAVKHEIFQVCQVPGICVC